ncbi:M20/M25/M40 family metallo-hydrolase [Agrobacterium rhizogenes]|uniref:M20/M25/M40 family metallo-hydrolase n=1 Tax=Rhizobium rhizogenes TaxID=359 RepID=UPI0022B75075|nr:M20/M25/M40 family metallo-hydrolase [Rhizobium rhizogenes]MCZ7449676.1 M20/M25/M40 family metallo-hydrolase [Rhizobium rhizogenes]
MPDTATVDTVLAYVDAGLEQSVERLQDLLRIKSISTDLAFAQDCKAAAQWLVDDLTACGFEVATHLTPGHPIVVAHDRDGVDPHVLFYGHYDVQPVDPLDLWSTDPFAPQVKTVADGTKVITGRGASDDKGQLMTFIEACRAWRQVVGKLPIRVSILLEGEEESGGKNLPAFIEANSEELKADVALVCDTDMWDRQTPCVTTMLRGFVGEEMTVFCANRDLHSGTYGGAARNPNRILAEIIASLHDADGRVAIEGFYEDVAELPTNVKEQWRGLGFDDKAFLADVGLSLPSGERDRSVIEMLWSRPTCEINGISGGYIGEGFKTVIPARAGAKISFRLVSNMDPRKIRESFRTHVRARIPPDCSVTFTDHGGSPALTVPSDGSLLNKALAALTREWGKPAVIIGDGGSIPVGGECKRILGIDTLFIGFAQNDDRIHSPNEKYDLMSFHKGIRSWVRLLDAFAR